MARYDGHRVAFLTQHGKEALLRPLFSREVGCEIVRAEGFDTDLLGTFTRDIDRPGSQLAAARTKAAKAIELTGERIGLGSEGAFGADPVGGLMPWNTEVLVWHDAALGLEVIGTAHGPGHSLQRTVSDEDALHRFAEAAGFPAHGLVLRPDTPNDSRIIKGLRDWPALREAFAETLRASPSGQVFVETDLRAHMNPTRQRLILEAAENLVARLQSACPACDAPGFWEKERVGGLPCGLCGTPTRLPPTSGTATPAGTPIAARWPQAGWPTRRAATIAIPDPGAPAGTRGHEAQAAWRGVCCGERKPASAVASLLR